jgi:hypothetical protein
LDFAESGLNNKNAAKKTALLQSAKWRIPQKVQGAMLKNLFFRN